MSFFRVVLAFIIINWGLSGMAVFVTVVVVVLKRSDEWGKFFLIVVGYFSKR